MSEPLLCAGLLCVGVGFIRLAYLLRPDVRLCIAAPVWQRAACALVGGAALIKAAWLALTGRHDLFDWPFALVGVLLWVLASVYVHRRKSQETGDV